MLVDDEGYEWVNDADEAGLMIMEQSEWVWMA